MQFLDCLSVFSEHAPRDLKIYYAFKIYDYDSDDVSGKQLGGSLWLISRHASHPFLFQFISEADIRQVLRNLTKNELTLDEQQKITEKIIEEGDIDSGAKMFIYERLSGKLTISSDYSFADGKLSFLEFETLMKRAPDFISTFHIRIWGNSITIIAILWKFYSSSTFTYSSVLALNLL